MINEINKDDCLMWGGFIDIYGYGTITQKFKGKSYSYKAHRLMYELFVGTIPEGLVLDHLCRIRCCVNPEHLEPVTHRVNILRGNGYTAHASRKTHCPKGHSYQGSNLIVDKRGYRTCRECNRLKSVTTYQLHSDVINAKRRKIPRDF